MGMDALACGAIRAAETGWAGWTDPLAFAILWIGLAVRALFARLQRPAAPPIMPRRPMMDPARATAYAVPALLLGGMIGLTIHLQQVPGLSPALTGLVFLPAMQ